MPVQVRLWVKNTIKTQNTNKSQSIKHSMKNIKITQEALTFLKKSLDKEKKENLNLYISTVYELTNYAHVNIIYCYLEDINKKDIKLEIENINIYVSYKSIKFLEDAIIDVKNENLLINAPNLNSCKKTTSSINDEIKNILENEINAVLSQHGGFIELINIENEDTINIKFHGGCQGCGMVNYTLNNYIEKIIKNKFPQIKKINDITSHNIKTSSYY